MTAKIVEVLTKILEGLSNDSSIEEVNRALIKSHKFDRKILGIAFSLIYDKILTKGKNRETSKNYSSSSSRILSEPEKEALGVDNYNYLLHLINVGLLDYENLEMILDQLSIFPENKVTRKEINWIILISLVEFESEVLPGSRMLLYSSDTVN